MLLLLTHFAPDAAAQSRRNRRANRPVYGARIEKQVQLPDSLDLARRDSLRQVDSLRRVDSVALLGKSSLDVPAFSHAADSMISDFSNGRRRIYYYGSTSVKYQDMELTANYMEYDMNAGTVFARGVYDSLNGTWNGQPVMKQGNQSYNMEEVRYNFNSRKARIKNMVTNDAEGILHGRDIKMMDDHSLNLSHGKYTVCEEDHPHYYIDLSLGKVISQTKTTVFGPAHLVVEDVHLPFVGLPFGFIPKRPQRATGLLMPSFGEDAARGFYMRDLGMYFVLGDYLDFSLTGSYYTLGSWNVDLNSRYKVNYKFGGNLSVTYSHNQTGDKDSPDFRSTSDFGFRWSHSQDSKAHPGVSFSASVNFSSPTNDRYNSHSYQEAMNNVISSSISWSRNWNGKITLSVNATHSQNSQTKSYNISLPNVKFDVSTFYPFKRKNRVGKEQFYERISFKYGFNFTNSVNFNADEFAFNTELLNKFRNSMRHNFSIGLPDFTLLNYFKFAPSLSYDQDWYFRKTEYAFDPETNKPEALESHHFNTLGIYQQYSGGISMSTRLYGMFNFGKHHRIQAIRHVIDPRITYSVQPNLATRANGFRTLEYVDTTGHKQSFDYNIYGLSATGLRQSSTMTINIGNTLEAKVRDFADTTGKGTKIVKLINGLDISTGYDFLKDSLKMSDVRVSMRATLFNKIPFNASATFSPYARDIKANRYVNRFAITEGQGLLVLTSFNCSVSYSFSGKGTMNGYDGTGSNGRGSTAGDYYQQFYLHPLTGDYVPGGWVYYANPNAPWSINPSFSLTYAPGFAMDPKTKEFVRKDRITASLNVSGNLKLTPKMNIRFNGGYDFVQKKLTSPSFNFTYDLHCFNIAVDWIPAGLYQSYSFRIAANAAALADLLRFKKSSGATNLYY